jgi:diaminohydroxyphosphoribosylaminopyrimidine deaminase / 5-amino-6-(5-phosphoribosylamino)uracil reductase
VSAAADLAHMAAALSLARRGLGQVWPNPAVGCVIVKEGRVVGRGWTQPGGRPHAETEALSRAGAAAQGATAYVSLEPCAHHGKTPPCAEALVAAKIARCVAASEDPDPRVSGRGLALLRKAGVAVEAGLLGEEATALNAGFLLRQAEGRPLVTLKLAQSLDGGIATAEGESRWITGEAARRHGHLLRAEHDAVMVGSGTALADDPRLSVRLEGLEHRSPLRLVADGRLRLPLTAVVVSTARQQPTWILTRKDADRHRRAAFAGAGVEVIALPTHPEETLDLQAGLQALGERGVTRVLVEGGGVLAAGLLRAGLVDRVALYRAPLLLGADATPAVAPLGLQRLAEAPGFRLLEALDLGPDRFEHYGRR